MQVRGSFEKQAKECVARRVYADESSSAANLGLFG